MSFLIVRLYKYKTLVAEWIHFTLFGIISPTIKLKVYAFGGLMNSAPQKQYTQYSKNPTLLTKAPFFNKPEIPKP